MLERTSQRLESTAELFPLLEGGISTSWSPISARTACMSRCGFQDQILDGRNRYRACLAAEIDPAFRPFMGDDPLAFVISPICIAATYRNRSAPWWRPSWPR